MNYLVISLFPISCIIFNVILSIHYAKKMYNNKLKQLDKINSEIKEINYYQNVFNKALQISAKRCENIQKIQNEAVNFCKNKN